MLAFIASENNSEKTRKFSKLIIAIFKNNIYEF